MKIFIIVIDLIRQNAIFRARNPSPCLLGCAVLQQLMIRPTDQFFYVFALEFQALSGQSLAIVTRALETLCGWSQKSVSCRFERGKEFSV